MKEFNVVKEVNNIIEFIRYYYKKNNLNGAIIGISGGKDSGVVAALMVMAIGCENVIGVTLPCYSNKDDLDDAKLISDYYNFKLINYDLDNSYNVLKNTLGNDEYYAYNSNLNLKPRLRMLSLYYLAALYTSKENRNYIVVGTSNKCEKYVGYFTKGGDSVADIFPILDYTVSEVIEIGKYLKVPEKVLLKIPSDGLGDLSDEEKLGVKYSDIEKYFIDKNSVSDDIRKRIDYLHKINNHKNKLNYYRRLR